MPAFAGMTTQRGALFPYLGVFGDKPAMTCRRMRSGGNVDEDGICRAGLRRRDREGRRRADARRRPPQGRRVPARCRRALSRHPQSRPLPEGQALDPARHAGGKAQPAHELGDGEPAVVGAARLRGGARRRARQRQVAGPVRAVVANRSTSTTPSNGRRRSPGATAMSGSAAFPTTPSTSGSSPTTSRPRSRRSFPGKASPTSTAMRCSTAASSACSCPTGSWRT
jgi:hypothetical protein